ncbi:hypothetical protein PIB30_050987 [Stylosanthes scabra]|uniref:AAA ATPase AAA+ lid domain-containing protein n=1 Tax=Stylosanthes scabra TaxID=79078 RepID=A0ABU6SHQ6_9FABA|nr:hypothetical protein [Stylosanthes scabra]
MVLSSAKAFLSLVLQIGLIGWMKLSSVLVDLARKKPLDSAVDLRAIAKACENFSGADLAELVDEAARAAIEEILTAVEGGSGDINTCMPRHFDIALSKVSSSVCPAERLRYKLLADRFKAS